jgi:ABC-type transport system involved in multi-copper enzyme maturation permease subunit
MRDILTVTHLTISEARRRRIVTAASICAAVFLTLFVTATFFANREATTDETPFLQRQVLFLILTLAGLFASNFLSVLFALLLPVDTLSGEIDSGVMQTLASKPIRRADIVVGKWLGHTIIASAYVFILMGGVLLSVRLMTGFSALRIGVAPPLILLEMALLVTVSIAGGTRLGTVTNGVAALGFYGIAFIGGWLEQIGTMGGFQSVRQVGIAASLLSPSDALWRLATYHMQPPLLRGFHESPFMSMSIPTPLMVWWALAFTALVLAAAIWSFRRRAL